MITILCMLYHVVGPRLADLVPQKVKGSIGGLISRFVVASCQGHLEDDKLLKNGSSIRWRRTTEKDKVIVVDHFRALNRRFQT